MKSKIIYISITFFIFLTINKYLLYKDVEKQKKDIAVINISGKQRMYSQKIAKLALYFDMSKNKSIIDTKVFKKTLDRFEKEHTAIINKYIKNSNDVLLIDLYDDIEPYFFNIVNSGNLLLSNLKNEKKTNEHIFKIKANEAIFLKKMGDIVLKHQKNGEKRIDDIRIRETTFNVVYCIILLYVLTSLLFKVKPFSRKKH